MWVEADAAADNRPAAHNPWDNDGIRIGSDMMKWLFELFRQTSRPVRFARPQLELLGERLAPSATSLTGPGTHGEVPVGHNAQIHIVTSDFVDNDIDNVGEQPFQYTIHWNDGSPDSAGVLTVSGSQLVANLNHTLLKAVSTIQFTLTEAGDGDFATEDVDILTSRLVVDRTFTTNSKSLVVDYEVIGTGSTSFTLDVYRSGASLPNGGSQVRIYETTLTGSAISEGQHEIMIAANQFFQGQALRPDPTHHFVMVTLDEAGAFNSDDSSSPPTGNFRIWVVGAVTHGYTFTFIGSPSPQTWVDTMANSLKTVDHYDAAVAYHWESTSVVAKPGQAVAAGGQMAQAVFNTAESLPVGPDDVVDVHFIGHSRGSVVISAALTKLDSLDAAFLPLQAGFMKMTMLDPHPARNATTGMYSRATSGLKKYLADVAVSKYLKFQSQAQDPSVVVPANVQLAEDYYQHTKATQNLPYSESILNLWGESSISSPIAIDFHNLTGSGIGHHEVIDYYQHNVVDKGLTFKPF